MKTRFFVRILLLSCVVCLSFVFFKERALAQETIGRLSTFKGEVKLERKGKLISLKVNMPLFSKDEIETKKGMAKIEFLDGSFVSMEPNTDLILEQVEKKRYILGVWGKPYLSRTIKVNKGKIKGDIKPRKDLLTEFETPSVVAQLKGTTLSIEVDKTGKVTMIVDSGEIYAIAPDGWSVFTLSTGESVAVYWDSETKSVSVHSYLGTVSVKTGDVICSIDPGDAMTSTVDPDTGAAYVRATTGTIEVTVGTAIATLEEGESLSGDLDPATGRATVAITAGEVPVTSVGVTQVVTAGMGTTVERGMAPSSPTPTLPPVAAPPPPAPPAPPPPVGAGAGGGAGVASPSR